MARAINTKSASAAVVRTDNFDRLTADIRRIPMLTESEFDELMSEYQTTGSTAAKQRIASANLRFALSVAKKYTSDAGLLSELVSEATIGLYKAVEKYDSSLGFKFISFAVHQIRAQFSEYFRTRHDLVRRSNNAAIGNKDLKVAEKLFQTLEREPSEEEIMDALQAEYGIEVGNKLDIIRLKTDSFSEKVDEDGAERGEVGELALRTASRNEFEDEVEQEDREDKAEQLLSTIPVGYRDIVRKAFGIGYDRSYEDAEIADELGYTAERVRQIKLEALGRMRKVAKMAGIAM